MAAEAAAEAAAERLIDLLTGGLVNCESKYAQQIVSKCIYYILLYVEREGETSNLTTKYN